MAQGCWVFIEQQKFLEHLATGGRLRNAPNEIEILVDI
jgi:hypothetical protein